MSTDGKRGGGGGGGGSYSSSAPPTLVISPVRSRDDNVLVMGSGLADGSVGRRSTFGGSFFPSKFFVLSFRFRNVSLVL